MQVHKRLLFLLPLYRWENGDVPEFGGELLGLSVPGWGLADGRAMGSPLYQRRIAL